MCKINLRTRSIYCCQFAFQAITDRMILAKSHEAKAMDNNRQINKQLKKRLEVMDKEFITLFEDMHEKATQLKRENEANKLSTGHLHLEKEITGMIYDFLLWQTHFHFLLLELLLNYRNSPDHVYVILWTRFLLRINAASIYDECTTLKSVNDIQYIVRGDHCPEEPAEWS